MRLSASWMSYPAVSLGDRFCMSQKGRTGGGGCMGAPEGCKQHGHVWSWSWRTLGWSRVDLFSL